MKKDDSNEFTADQITELAALATMPEDEIDTSDTPEVLDWSSARRGLFYQHPERLVPVDADVLEWFQAQANGNESYRSRINQALRQYVTEQVRKAG